MRESTDGDNVFLLFSYTSTYIISFVVYLLPSVVYVFLGFHVSNGKFCNRECLLYHYFRKCSKMFFVENI